MSIIKTKENIHSTGKEKMQLTQVKYILNFQNRLNYLFFFLRFYLFIFRERGKEGDREGEKYQCVAASPVPPTWDLACNSDMCPDWELNQ